MLLYIYSTMFFRVDDYFHLMSRTARAALIEEVGVDGFEIRDIELDDPKPNEVRINIEYAGACHTDWHAIDGDLASEHYPTIGGHEGAGIIEEVGTNVERVDIGDRVLTVWIPACGECEMCIQGYQHLCNRGGENLVQGYLSDGTFRFHDGEQDIGQYFLLGTFAEQTVVPEESVVPIPDEMPLDKASIVGCGVTTGFGAAAFRADIDPGDTVAIIGTGNVGLNAIQGAKHSGAGKIVAIDPIEFKRNKAQKFGATHTIDPSQEDQTDIINDISNGKGAETAIFTVGVGDGKMIGEAYQTLSKRGELVIAATAPDEQIKVPPVDLILTEKEIKGVLYGSVSPQYSTQRIVDLYLNNEYMLDDLISTGYSLDDINDAYDQLLNGDEIHPVLSI